MAKVIKKITFDANIDGWKYRNVPIEITENNGYTDEDIADSNGKYFGSHIGKKFYDLHVFTNPKTNRIEINAELLRRTKKGKWIVSNESTSISITNVKVKYCEGLR